MADLLEADLGGKILLTESAGTNCKRANELVSCGAIGARFEVVEQNCADISLRKINVRHCREQM